MSRAPEKKMATTLSVDGDADVARVAALLAANGRGASGDGAAAREEALALARACVAADASRPQAHAMLARALVLCRRSDEAVKVCKAALVRHAGDAQLEAELRSARFAVLNELDSDEEEEEEEDGGRARVDDIHGFTGAAAADHTRPHATASQPTAPPPINEAFGAGSRAPDATLSSSGGGPGTVLAFDAKVEKLLVHLDLQRLLRVGLWYTLLELLQLRTVTAGLVSLFLGVLAQAVMHRHKFMVVSMLVVGLAHSQLRVAAEKHLHKWVHTSSDKLGAVVWLPRVVLALPVVLKIVGHLRFMLFLQRDSVLSLVVALTTGACVAAAAWQNDDKHPLKQWGYGKRLKFVAYATAALYWVLWRGHFDDTLRLLGPAFLDAGGILLSSASSADIQSVCRRAWKRVFDEVAVDVQQDVDFDAWFFLGLTNWGIDYWQQPTTISLELLMTSLSEAFASFEKHAVHLFRPELHRLGQQMRHLDQHATEMALLVAYLKQSLESVPPRKWLGFLGLVLKRCASFVVAALLLVFYGTIALPLVPFMVSEAADARALCVLYGSEEMDAMDGLDVLLVGSPLLRVWANAKAAVYCLEGGVALSSAVATGVQIVSAATRLARVAAFAAKVKTAGLAAHADELPDHITSLFVVVSDYTAIADGVRRVYESAHLQDLGGSLRRWWAPDKQE